MACSSAPLTGASGAGLPDWALSSRSDLGALIRPRLRDADGRGFSPPRSGRPSLTPDHLCGPVGDHANIDGTILLEGR
jgi:hypothetical protein